MVEAVAQLFDLTVGAAVRFVYSAANYKEELRDLMENLEKYRPVLNENLASRTRKKFQKVKDERLIEQWTKNFEKWCRDTEEIVKMAKQEVPMYYFFARRSIWIQINTQKDFFLEKVKKDLPLFILCRPVQLHGVQGYQKQQVPDFIIPMDGQVNELITLVEDPSRSKWIGIHGKGGSGKSLLARLINNSSRVYDHFEGRVFLLAVGRGCDVQKLQRKLCDYLDLQCEKDSNIKKLLSDRLKACRTLLILDDVCEDQTLELFDVIDGSNGSKVLFTTRSLVVPATRRKAARVNSGQLCSSASKKLFCRYAFGNEQTPPGFDDLVEKMTKWCKGLPLALKVLGSSMSTKSDRSGWLTSVSKLERSHALVPQMDEDAVHVFNLFRFSYEDLETERNGSISIQACYLCMGAFEEHARVSIEELVALWRGEDLIPLLETGWDEARRILHILEVRSLLEVDNGLYHVHDILRELILLQLSSPKAEHEKGCIFLAGKTIKQERLQTLFAEEINEARKISLRATQIESLPSISSTACAAEASTLLLDRNNLLTALNTTVVTCLQNLKVLSMRQTGVQRLPEEICVLKKLYVLDLKDSQIEAVPSCLYDMTSLRYLDLQSSNSAGSRDFRFTSLHKLRNLEAFHITFKSKLLSIDGIGALTRLTSLILWCSSDGGSIVLPGSIKQLVNLRHLQLSAPVLDLKELEAGEADEFGCLETCVIRMGIMHGSWKTMFKNSKLLSHLELGTCSTVEEIPPIEQFRVLKFLKLHGCTMLPTTFATLSWAFPSLKTLIFKDCTFSNLPELNPGALQMLTKLEFSSCRSFRHLSWSIAKLPRLAELYVNGGGLLEGLLPEESEGVDKHGLAAFPALQVLMLEDTSITSLPRAVGASPELRQISLRRCMELKCLLLFEEAEETEENLFPKLAELDISASALGFEMIPPVLVRSTGTLKDSTILNA